VGTRGENIVGTFAFNPEGFAEEATQLSFRVAGMLGLFLRERSDYSAGRICSIQDFL